MRLIHHLSRDFSSRDMEDLLSEKNRDMETLLNEENRDTEWKVNVGIL